LAYRDTRSTGKAKRRTRKAPSTAAAASLTAAALAFTGVPLSQAAPVTQAPARHAEAGAAAAQQAPGLKRQMENLDRAPVAIITDQGVTLGWRMLGLDRDSIGFHVIRDGVQITDEPIRNTTTYVDPEGTASSRYAIKAVGNGNGQDNLTAEFTPLAQNYFAIQLDKPADGATKDGKPYTYSANDASVADLDGDGKYEIIQSWAPSNAKDNSQSGYTGNVYVDAYTTDGTKLWRIDLGHNIRAGAHYTQVLAYDFDGDGKAEVAMKTADGTKDGAGTVIGDAAADYRNSSGYVLSGPCSTAGRAPPWTRSPMSLAGAASPAGATPTATAWTASSPAWPTSTANTRP
jgi:hypothetical protein